MCIFLKKIFVLLLLFVMGGVVSWAFETDGSVANDSCEDVTPIEVELLTVAPGADIYALDGHTALRFIDPQSKLDVAVNWGVFDFNAPNFMYRFVKGETDYMAYPFPTDYLLSEYSREGRTVKAQKLNLTPEEAARLFALVQENLKPENAVYRYNYIYDNCATRPFALIERVVDGKLQLNEFEGFKYGDTGLYDHDETHTFRGEMTRTHANYPWYQFGIDLALGSGLDKEIGGRERTYSPLYLHDALNHAEIVADNGESRRLVASENILVKGEVVTEPPTPFWQTPLFVAALLLAMTIAIVISDLQKDTVTRWFDSIYYTLGFIVGLFLTFLIFISVHEATSPNWLYLWLNPFCAIPAFFIWIKRWKCAVYCYQICNFVALFSLLLIGAIGIQELNGAFYVLIAADMLLSARYIYITRKRLKK